MRDSYKKAAGRASAVITLITISCSPVAAATDFRRAWDAAVQLYSDVVFTTMDVTVSERNRCHLYDLSFHALVLSFHQNDPILTCIGRVQGARSEACVTTAVPCDSSEARYSQRKRMSHTAYVQACCWRKEQVPRCKRARLMGAEQEDEASTGRACSAKCAALSACQRCHVEQNRPRELLP